MRLFTFLIFIFTLHTLFSQEMKTANVYPSNLEENMYFKGYDAKQRSIDGLNFLVLSDGNNSKDRTPEFEVMIYLMPVGKSSVEDLIVAKRYQLEGIFHMGSHEFTNESISLNGIDIPPGEYRLGIWVNSSSSFEEDQSDNATLFKNSIKITNSEPSKKTEKQTDNSSHENNTESSEEEENK